MSKINLTQSEKNTILTWLEKNIEEGYYYGNKKQYFKQLQSIKFKLETTQKETNV